MLERIWRVPSLQSKRNGSRTRVQDVWSEFLCMPTRKQISYVNFGLAAGPFAYDEGIQLFADRTARLRQ